MALSAPGPSVISPLVRALLDGFAEAVIMFDPEGHYRYANATGRQVLASLEREGKLDSRTLLPRLGRMGGRVERLQAGDLAIGHAVYLPIAANDGAGTLAQHERQAILDTLRRTGWRFTESARRLGISRTTLWRRLREYEISEDSDQEVR